MNCWSFVLKAVLCEYNFDNKQDCNRLLCGTSFTTSSCYWSVTWACSLWGQAQQKSSLLQVCQEAKAVLCEHKCYHHHPADSFHLLCLFQCNISMHGAQEEGHQHWWGVVPHRYSFGWTRTFTERTRSFCTCHRWFKGWEVLALLDHHHLHLHIHLLHHHLLRQQCPLHCSRIQPLWIDQKQPNMYLLSSIFWIVLLVLQRI